MAQFSRGQPPPNNHKSSRLRHAEQVPDSDTVVPETQHVDLQPHYGPDPDDEPLLQHEQEFISRNAYKPSVDPGEASQPLTARSLIYGFGVEVPRRPSPELSTFQFEKVKRGVNKTAAQEVAPAVQLPVQFDIVVPSIEPATSKPTEQDMDTEISAASPSGALSTAEQRSRTEIPDRKDTPSGRNKSQPLEGSSTTLANCPSAQCFESGIPAMSTATSNALHAIPVTRLAQKKIKAKKGKKMLLSRPPAPQEPRPDCSAGAPSPSLIPDESSHCTPRNDQSPTGFQTHNVENLAVKLPQNEHNVLPDGPTDAEQQPFSPRATLLKAASDTVHLPMFHKIKGDSCVNQQVEGRRRITPSLANHTPPCTSNLPSVSAEQSLSTTHETLDPNVDVLTGPTTICSSLTSPSGVNPKLQPVVKLGLDGQLGDIDQQLPIDPQTTTTESIRSRSSHSKDGHDILHKPSNRNSPTRVTKTSNKIRSSQNVHTRCSENSRMLSKSSPLDAALESIRTACVLERDQVQDRMAAVVNILEKDKTRLQDKVLEQQNNIAELEIQVKTIKEKFSKLGEKATTHQRYAAGLQKDYEKIQKSMAKFQEQNKQVLQDQISKLTEEKETLQMSFNSTIDVLTNSRRKMQKTMEEVWMHYVMSLSDKRDLENRINEHVGMYECEKSRRINVEEQLLSSFHDTQRQLSESSGTFIDKASTLYTNLKEREAEERNDCGIKDCLEILQKLDAKPLMTADDVRRAESILRSVRQRTNAGFKTLNRTMKGRSLTIDSIRDCMRNEAQDLQAEITRNNQAIVDGCQTREQVGKLEAELEARQHKLQQLEQQEESFRKHEEILKSHIKQLETERNELQATIETRQAQSDKMELDVQQLRDRLSEAETKSMSVQNEVNRRERLRMEQEQAFRMYRLNAVPHLAHSKEQMQQLTAQLQARDIEQHAQSQDLLDSNNKLVAIEQQCTQLLREVSGHRSTVAKLHKEKEAIETNHIAQLSELQQRLNKLQEAKDTSNEQLRRVELDAISKVEQTKEEYLTQIDELKTQLNLSEDARKEAQARVCQVEAANVQQLECHRQETNAKFEKLTIESTLVVARLKKEHLQELEEIRREFDIKFKNHVLEANRQLAEARAGTTNKVLVYNSQFSAEQIPKPASQQPQIGKTRKKVDRQTNSVLEVVPSTQRSVDTDRQASTADRLHPLNTGHEGSVYQNECFFDEEYQNRFGSQVQPREQDVRLSILDPESDVVPETQEFTFAQIESQKSAAGELQQKEIMSDLSTMPSDDLSEMLLDVGPSHGQEHETSRQVTSPDEALEDFGQPGNCPASDAHSTSSQGRPISRANTASRMMPLLAHSKPRQYRQADNIIHDPMREHSDRNSRDSSEELSNPVHTGHSVSRRPYASRSPMHDDVALKSYETGVKRKAHDGNVEQGGRSKKLCASTRSSNQGLSLTSKSYTPYSPTPDGALSNEDTQPSPHSTTGRRSSKRTSSSSGPQAGTLRLSSTRNTRSKGNKFSARFDQELERR